MTHIFNDPTNFASEMAEGYAAAYSRYVRLVPGSGVIKTRSEPDLVRVIVGGGSGHYPWSAGFVGSGMADGAVMGEVFTSPSAQQVLRVVHSLPDW
jgi:dihydroxyacetone kinase